MKEDIETLQPDVQGWISRLSYHPLRDVLPRLLHHTFDFIWSSDNEASHLATQLLRRCESRQGARIYGACTMLEEDQRMGPGGSCIGSTKRPAGERATGPKQHRHCSIDKSAVLESRDATQAQLKEKDELGRPMGRSWAGRGVDTLTCYATLLVCGCRRSKRLTG